MPGDPDWSYLHPAPPVLAANTRGLGVAPPSDGELDALYLMGFDAWGDGLCADDYLAMCRVSPKYRRGTWHCVRDATGEPVASMIAYRLILPSMASVIGLGSIATRPSNRGQGVASAGLSLLISTYAARPDVDALALFADRATSLYHRLGFRPLVPEHQVKPGATVMALSKTLSLAAIGPLRYF